MYTPGKFNLVADALSRLPMQKETKILAIQGTNDSDFSPITAKQIACSSNKDVVMASVIRFVTKGWPTEVNDKEVKAFYNR